jgi:hypothetical protein
MVIPLLALFLDANWSDLIKSNLFWCGFTSVVLTSVPVLAAIGLSQRARWVKSMSEEAKRAPDCIDGQPWRRPVDSSYIEDLKSDLLYTENVMLNAHISGPLLAETLDKMRQKGGLVATLQFIAWKTSLLADRFMDRPDFTSSQYREYLAQCAQLDRIWAGSAQIEISKLKTEIENLSLREQSCTREQEGKARDYQEDILEEKRDLEDLQHWVARPREHTYQAEFDDAKFGRLYDMHYEIFERCQAVNRKSDMPQQYSEVCKTIGADPTLSEKYKTELLTKAAEHFNRHLSNDISKSPISIYKVDT